MRAHYEAQLAEFKYEERKAKLVRRDSADAAADKTFQRFRDHLLTLPDRVAATIAEEPAAARVYELLTTAIRSVLKEFADSKDTSRP